MDAAKQIISKIHVAGEDVKTLVTDFHHKQSQQNPALLYSLYGAGGLLSLYTLYKVANRKRLRLNSTPHPADAKPLLEGCYDAVVIGAGPSGACAGFYLAQKGRKVVMLEKKEFPREKICGDAITTIAQKHMKAMGINLQEMVANNEGRWAQSGGFVSPNGYSFIGNSAVELKRDEEGAVIAIKRIVLDEKLARASARGGAELHENTTVEEATWDAEAGYWNIVATHATKGQVIYRARVVIAADGAPSAFARKKGLVNEAPQGVCSRAYISGEHVFEADGVVFYPPSLLPGYCALMRHAKNELGYCCYIIPGGPATKEDLSRLHHDYLKNDPFISKAVAGRQVNIERIKSGDLRLGGIEKSFADHLLIIGDAAGFIDPLTGEGIQYAMESGLYAAQTIDAGLEKGDLSEAHLSKYQELWYQDWGREFVWSMQMSLFLYRFPIMLDAAAKLINRRGARFLADWAEVMTGSQSKIWFLRPDVGPLLVLEAMGIFVNRLLGKK